MGPGGLSELTHGFTEWSLGSKGDAGEEVEGLEGVYMKISWSKSSLGGVRGFREGRVGPFTKGTAPSVPHGRMLARQCFFVWPDT